MCSRSGPARPKKKKKSCRQPPSSRRARRARTASAARKPARRPRGVAAFIPRRVVATPRGNEKDRVDPEPPGFRVPLRTPVARQPGHRLGGMGSNSPVGRRIGSPEARAAGRCDTAKTSCHCKTSTFVLRRNRAPPVEGRAGGLTGSRRACWRLLRCRSQDLSRRCVGMAPRASPIFHRL